MKIAFTSCMSANAYTNQPVWAQIQAKNPDVLVLLGDSVYNDCPPHPDENGNNHPSDSAYSDDAFAKYMHMLYSKQLDVPEFNSLIVNERLKKYAIWDDHDFMWNNAGESFAKSPTHKGQAYLSSNLFQCWRKTLSTPSIPFPTNHNDPAIQGEYLNLVNQKYDDYMPGYKSQALDGGKILLHLTDGRSWRKGSTLLGGAQRKLIQDAITENIKVNANALNLIASGSIFGRKGWEDYPDDYTWLLELASKHRILMLSGDIHKNRYSDPIATSSSLKLFEVISSGAAVNLLGIKNAGEIPDESIFTSTQKFGLLEINTVKIDVKFFNHNSVEIHKTIPISFT